MEEDFEKRKLDVEQHYDNEEEEEENIEEKIKTQWNPLLIKSAMKGDLETIKKCLDKRANLFYEEKKWNAFIWACSKGYTEIVRFLLEKGAGKPYLPKEEKVEQQQPTHYSTLNQENPNDKQEKKIGQGVINSSARPTPLQWACFKGHTQIVWLLLKAGLDLLETDAFGNNAIHQAVAGGNVDVVETLLQYGVRIDYKNNRGHTVMDLCTEPKIRQYLKEYENATYCNETHKAFGPGEIKYLCIISGKYFSKDATELHWIYENKDATECEKLERRSITAQEEVLRIERELSDLIKSYEYEKLCEKLQYIDDHNIHIGVKLLHKAHIHQEKLRTQILIDTYINSLKEVDNYKTIKKSINSINDMIEDAKKRNVHIDEDLLAKAGGQNERLDSERNLRFVLDNPNIGKSTPEEVEKIEELKRIAIEKGVAIKYCEEIDELLDKMKKNITANTIIQNFCTYPVRDWYPPVYYLDPKTKKPMDPATKKPMDPALLKPPPVKKKGKKAPKYVIPAWAVETAELGKSIKSLEELLLLAKEIDLDAEALQKSSEQMERMKKEFRYRKILDEEARILAEKNAKNKKKK